MQPDCSNNRPVKQYIVRGPFVTASQTAQNNKPQRLTKRCTPLRWALLCHLHVLSETSCFPLIKSSFMKSWLQARCIQIICFYWKNYVIFHWLITINIYMQKICAVFCVKCEEWQVGCHILSFGGGGGGVYRCNFHLTSGNVTWWVWVCASEGCYFWIVIEKYPSIIEYYFCLKGPSLIYIYKTNVFCKNHYL